jgi:hypothetical protein
MTAPRPSPRLRPDVSFSGVLGRPSNRLPATAARGPDGRRAASVIRLLISAFVSDVARRRRFRGGAEFDEALMPARHAARQAQAAGPHAEGRARQARRHPNARRPLPNHRRPYADPEPLHRTERRPEASGAAPETRSAIAVPAAHHRAGGAAGARGTKTIKSQPTMHLHYALVAFVLSVRCIRSCRSFCCAHRGDVRQISSTAVVRRGARFAGPLPALAAPVPRAQNIAIGLTGAPVALGSANGLTLNINSQRLREAAASLNASRSARSSTWIPRIAWTKL